jgi:hypothetical protein
MSGVGQQPTFVESRHTKMFRQLEQNVLVHSRGMSQLLCDKQRLHVESFQTTQQQTTGAR